MTAAKWIMLVSLVLFVVGLGLVIIGQSMKKASGGVPDRKGKVLAKVGYWLAGNGLLYALLCYFLGIRGAIDAVGGMTRAAISLVLLVGGFVLMRVGHSARKRAATSASRSASVMADTGYWVMDCGVALGLLNYLLRL